MTTPDSDLNVPLRNLPALQPGDSIRRTLQLFHQEGADLLPVVDERGHLAGVVRLRSLRKHLGHATASDTHEVVAFIEPAPVVLTPYLSSQERRRLSGMAEDNILLVIDDQGGYLGALFAIDLLVPQSEPPWPRPVGGMATMRGVYLTNGNLQAGASNVDLVVTGAILGLGLAVAHALVAVSCYIVDRATNLGSLALLEAFAPTRLNLQTLGWFLLHGITVLVFLLIMRLLPLSGYHAAEHQVVHAMERGEMLETEILRRMPRVHPRCGTNIMAGGIVLTLVSQLLVATGWKGLDPGDATLLGLIVAAFTWRRLGAVLQQSFTTRPATDRQLRSGISAALELRTKYVSSWPRRSSTAWRLWCMGLPQVVFGASAGSTAALLVFDWMFGHLK